MGIVFHISKMKKNSRTLLMDRPSNLSGPPIPSVQPAQPANKTFSRGKNGHRRSAILKVPYTFPSPKLKHW